MIQEHITSLSIFKNLSLIELDVSATAKTTNERIEAAIEVLRNSRARGGKILVVHRSKWVIPEPTSYEDGKWYWYEQTG